MPEILDQFGRPVKSQIVERKATDLIKSLGRDRDSLAASVATGITPQRLASIFRDNDGGDNTDMAHLALEMPERDLHYFSQLQIRRNATVGAQISVSAEDEKNAAAVEIAEQFERYVVRKLSFRWMIADFMDAINVGYSVIQPIWDTTTTPWTFREFKHQDARAFIWRDGELRIKVQGSTDGRPIPPGAFIVHLPRIRTGIPSRGGLARLAASTWFLKTFGVKSWVSFIEVYGMPLRLGRYDDTATDTEKLALLQTLISLGHDAAAILPMGMNIEFPDARRPISGDNLYEGLCRYFDASVSKAVNGQTMSSDDGSSQSQALVHEHVRLDIAEHDCLTMQATVDVIARLWTQFQFGVSAPVPVVEFDPRPAEGEKEKAETLELKGKALTAIKAGGFRVPLDEAREFLGIRVEEAPEPEPMVPGEPGAPGQASNENTPPGRQAAANASIPDTALPDVTDHLIAGALDGWQDTLGPHRAAVEAAGQHASSYAEFEAALDGLADQIDSNPLVRDLAIAAMKARGAAEA